MTYFIVSLGAVIAVRLMDLQLPMQSVTITTDILNSNLDHGQLYNINTIILCCPCYMPKYVPRLEGIIHDPKFVHYAF